MLNFNESKCLIAYFSRTGENYFNGKITNLSVGNTEIAAGIIHNIIKSDLFRIDTLQPYPDDYKQTTKLQKKKKLRQ